MRLVFAGVVLLTVLAVAPEDRPGQDRRLNPQPRTAPRVSSQMQAAIFEPGNGLPTVWRPAGERALLTRGRMWQIERCRALNGERTWFDCCRLSGSF